MSVHATVCIPVPEIGKKIHAKCWCRPYMWSRCDLHLWLFDLKI